MKYRARFGDGAQGASRSRTVEITGDGAVPTVQVDGEPIAFDVATLADGSFSIIGPDGRHVQATVHREPDGTMRVNAGNAVYLFEFLDELTARALETAGKRGGRKSSDVKAPIPGRVLRVLVQPGETVEAGKPLLVLEAMKMENEVRAPRDGTIASIEVAAGQAVGAGELLARFAPE